MSVRNIAIRLQAEGGAEIKRVLQDAGTAGKAAFDDVGAAADRAGAATDRLTQRNKDAANAAREAQNAATGAANAGGGSGGAGRPGGTAPAGGGSTVSPATPSVPQPTDTTRRETEALRRRLDEDYRNQRQRDRDEDIIRRGGTSGAFDETEQARLLYLSRQRYAVNDNEGASRGLTGYQKKDLLYQGGDVVASLGSGSGVGTVAFQQGPQILQGLATGEGGLAGGLKQLAVSAGSLVTPFTVAGAAVLAAAGVFAYGATQVSRDQDVLEKATKGLGRSTGTSASALNDLAQRNAAAGKVSTSTAREIAASYASTGSIAVPIFDTLISKTSEYARVTGQDVPAATAELARMFADPAKGADDLANKLGGLDDKTRQLIQTQAEQGDKTAAQTTLADALRAAIDANAASTGRWAQAWNTAAAAADGFWESAKRAVQIRLERYGLGDGPSATQSEVDKLNVEIGKANEIRKFGGQEPLGIGSDLIRRRDTAALIVDTARREAEAAAAEERANKASRTAGDIARSADPNYARLSDLKKQSADLSEALADPLARKKLADFDQTETAYLGVKRAIDTLTDSNGKLISSEEMVRRQDQLRLDAVKAKTEAEKADVAQRQKAFDLIGKTVTGSDARGQIERAGLLARAEASSKGGSESEKTDEYDRALKQADDRIRRQSEETTTYGMTADVVARYRTETELLAAAKRAERDITPELTAEVQSYAEKAAAAAQEQQGLRESMRDMDDLRGTSRSTLSSFATDLSRGTSAADAMASAFDRIKSKVLDLASTSLVDSLFGKSGTSATGLLGGLFGGSGGGMGASIASFFGFDSGGYTGPGGVLEAAGIVHRGEVVYSQADVARHGGVAAVEARRLNPGIRGYDDGGYVSPFTMPSRAAMSSTANGNFNLTVIEAPGGDKSQSWITRDPDGSPGMVVEMISRQQAGEMASGRGPFAAAVPGARRLRG